MFDAYGSTIRVNNSFISSYSCCAFKNLSCLLLKGLIQEPQLKKPELIWVPQFLTERKLLFASIIEFQFTCSFRILSHTFRCFGLSLQSLCKRPSMNHIHLLKRKKKSYAIFTFFISAVLFPKKYLFLFKWFQQSVALVRTFSKSPDMSTTANSKQTNSKLSGTLNNSKKLKPSIWAIKASSPNRIVETAGGRWDFLRLLD